MMITCFCPARAAWSFVSAACMGAPKSGMSPISICLIAAMTARLSPAGPSGYTQWLSPWFHPKSTTPTRSRRLIALTAAMATVLPQ